MAARRKQGRTPQVPRRFGAIASLAALVAGGAIAYYVGVSDPVVLPAVDLQQMEPQVAERIQQRMAEVSAAPRSADSWGQLGLSLQAHGLDAEAVECYRKALERDEMVFRWSYLLIHALRASDADAALAQTTHALELDATYPPLHLIRAELLEERNELDEAHKHYETALRLDPESALAAFGAGRLLAANGELDEAQALLSRAAELDENAGAIHGALAQVYRRQGDRERAAAAARFAAEHTDAVRIVDPLHFEMRRASVSSLALLDVAVRAGEEGDFERAVEVLRQLVALRPEDADMRARLGDALMGTGRASDAFEHYREAVEIQPDHTWALRGMGNASNMEGRVERAEGYYREALSRDPNDVPSLLNLGSLLAFAGDVGESEQLFRRGLEIDPSHFGCHRQLGELLLRTDRPADAEMHFEAALSEKPDFGPVHASLALALGRQGRFEEVWAHVEQAEALGAPLPPNVVTALRRASSGRGEPEP